MLWIFQNPKYCNYFKSIFKHLEIIILEILFCHIFYMSYSIMTWNWKWKKMLFSLSSKYSYFKPIFNYTRKGFWKGILICQIWDTLTCFCPLNPIVSTCVMNQSKGHWLLSNALTITISLIMNMEVKLL
jgi:hypothetical protein